ncbi:MAG: cell division protein ZapA [Alphaproteobacteria bacterium GM202ARS2]|nr:cell division protein ZapA [Alphaproteobacteria bacterium GM202ARS2]
MGNVTLTIRKVDYTVACADGDEARVLRLATQLNEHVSNLAQQFPRADDTMLLVMATLVILDSHDSESPPPRPSTKAPPPKPTDKDLTSLSQRLQALIDTIKGRYS